MLELSGVTVTYGAAAAVSGLDLVVRPGEIVGLIGPNGAGKSTTLNTIAGVLKPASGSIVFEGTDIAGRPAEEIVGRGIALVPEGRQIFGSLTVRENLQVAMSARPKRGVDRGAELDRMFELFPVLGRYAKTTADRLSGGEQQQLAIARALLTDPRILLLDEPSLGLAPQLVQLVFELLATLRDRGMTVLIVEQNAMQTIRLADRTYVLRSGRVAFSGDRDEMETRGDLLADYLGTRRG